LNGQPQPGDLPGAGHLGCLADQFGGQRVAALAEQVVHLFRGHQITDGQAVDPVQAGAGRDRQW